MNTTWLTWTCLWFGIKALLVGGSIIGAIGALVFFSLWLGEEKQRPGIVIAVWVTLLSTIIVVLGALTCAGILK